MHITKFPKRHNLVTVVVSINRCGYEAAFCIEYLYRSSAIGTHGFFCLRRITVCSPYKRRAKDNTWHDLFPATGALDPVVGAAVVFSCCPFFNGYIECFRAFIALTRLRVELYQITDTWQISTHDSLHVKIEILTSFRSDETNPFQ